MKWCSSSFCKFYGKKCGLRCWLHRWARVSPEVWESLDRHRREIIREFFFGT